MPRTMPAARRDSKTSGFNQKVFRVALLNWYDRQARVLPWRYPPGKTADPYRVWLSEIMLQQTTVPAVIPYFGKFVDKWPDVRKLAAARDEDVMTAWAGLGYYARARNLLKCARVVANEYGGVFPDTVAALKELPGIGDYTGAAIAAIAFGRGVSVVDGNVERVVSRYFSIQSPLPGSKADIRAFAGEIFEGRGITRPGDFAQAMMDLGAVLCTPRNPKCGLCPVARHCQGRIEGIAGDLPRKTAKTARPKRAGYVYWITNASGAVLFETRPEKGLLGGMTGLPTSEWGRPGHIRHNSAMGVPDNYRGEGTLKIRHVFTHFDLELHGVAFRAPRGFRPGPGQFWVPPKDIAAQGLPSVFRKFVRLMVD